MNILITGGLGYIGCRLIQQILIDFPDASLQIIDQESQTQPDSFLTTEQASQVNHLKADLFSFDLETLSERPDYIIHLAASVDPDSYKDTNKSNFALSKIIADFSLKNNSKLIFPSTTSIYGISHPSLKESMDNISVSPQTAYAADKYKTEMYLRQLAFKGLRYCILRLATIFGTSPNVKFVTAVQKFCFQAFQEKRIAVWKSSLKQLRPYLDINDAVSATTHILKENLFSKSPYHLATLSESVESILYLIKRCTNLEIVTEESHRMNELSYELNCERIIKSGFKFQGNLEFQIGEIFKSFETNQVANKK